MNSSRVVFLSLFLLASMGAFGASEYCMPDNPDVVCENVLHTSAEMLDLTIGTDSEVVEQ